MQKLIGGSDIWIEIAKLSKNAKQRRAAVAYVTSCSNVAFRRGDMLVVDASDGAIETRQTSRRLLARMIRDGIKVYSLARLHAKIILLDRVAVIGSTNLSTNSQSLTEAAIVTDDRHAVAQVKEFIQRLAAASRVVDGAFLKHLMTLRLSKPTRMRGKAVKISGRSTLWVVGTYPLTHKLSEKEERHYAAGRNEAEDTTADPEDLEFLRFGRDNSAFTRKAKRGDHVIEIWREQRHATEVWRDAFIRSIRRGPTWTHFHLEYVSDKRITRPAFESLWRKCGGKTLPKRPCRAIDPKFAEKLLATWV